MVSIDPAEIPSLELVPQLRYDFSGTPLQLADFSGTPLQRVCDSLGTVTAEQRTATPIILANDKSPQIKTFCAIMSVNQSVNMDDYGWT